MALSRIATAVGGLLLSKAGRQFAGRHAGKLALATLAWELYRQHKANQGVPEDVKPGPQTTHAKSDKHPRSRWSGRRA